MRDEDQAPNCPGARAHHTIETSPPGTIDLFAGSSIPVGWLTCDGRELKKADHRRLFDALGTSYGAGSTDDVFKIPDFRGRMPLGKGQGAGLTNRAMGDSGGEETHVLTNSEYAPHSHAATNNVREATAGANPGRSAGTGASIVTVTIDNNAGGSGHNTMSRFQVVNFIIKT